MEWFRWYHGAVSDPKWPLIARKAGVSVGVVVSVWAALLEHASQDEERGSVAGFDGETIDALYGYADGVSAAVVEALRCRGVIRDGCISAWRRRQPKRERDDDSAERVRRHRENRRQADTENSDNTDACSAVTPCNATATPGNDRLTPRNAQNRAEQNRPDQSTADQSTADQNTAERNTAERSTAERKEEKAPAPVLLEEPGMEFVDLRDFWDRECRPEGPLSGWQEYKALKAARRWPGISRISQDVEARYASGAWAKGFAKGLGNYLRERLWLAEVVVGPRKASRAGPRAPTVFQQNMQFKDDFATRELAARGIHLPGGGAEHEYDGDAGRAGHAECAEHDGRAEYAGRAGHAECAERAEYAGHAGHDGGAGHVIAQVIDVGGGVRDGAQSVAIGVIGG